MCQSTLVLAFYFIVMFLTTIWVYQNRARSPVWYLLTFELVSFVYAGLMAITVINHGWWWLLLVVTSFIWTPVQVQGYRWGLMWKDANAERSNNWTVLVPRKPNRYLLRFVFKNSAALIGFGFFSLLGWLIDTYIVG